MINIIDLIKEIKTDWKEILLPIAEKYKESINKKLNDDLLTYDNNLEIVPPKHLIFEAFNKFNFSELKVLIISQDPYIHKGEAMGLCFSVPENTKIPPSLRNIFKALEQQYSIKRTNTNLTDWANQGVLLLNVALTTLEKNSGFHMKIWKNFTNDLLTYISKNKQNLGLMLWGNFAKSYTEFFDNNTNLILTYTHPSPLSRSNFTNCNHFQLCNNYLLSNNKTIIKWV